MSATPASPTGHGFSPRGGRGHGHHRLRKTVLTILGLAILGGLVFWIVVATSGGGGPVLPINPSTGKSSTSLSAGQTYVSNGVTIIVQGNASGVTVNVPNNGTEAGYDPITQADVTGWCKHAFPNDSHAAAVWNDTAPTAAYGVQCWHIATSSVPSWNTAATLAEPDYVLTTQVDFTGLCQGLHGVTSAAINPYEYDPEKPNHPQTTWYCSRH